ncbi:MAG TPA: pyrroloquinoline quinone biosynthesis peptide chaperone PqqD [Verrucomicrobiae bacterium]|nr:pyrroloquinoline quinone biosynthesis peptide chaperone PqqD [Verrucomicrobiae bacterium]
MNAIEEQRRPALARGVRIGTDPKTNEPMLLFPEGVIYLNPTAHDIVKRCDGQVTTQSLIAALADEYETDVEALRHDVLDCLADLHQRKVLVFCK